MKNKKIKLIEFGILQVNDSHLRTECYYEIDRCSNGCRVLLSATPLESKFTFYKAFDSYLECVAYMQKVTAGEILAFFKER